MPGRIPGIEALCLQELPARYVMDISWLLAALFLELHPVKVACIILIAADMGSGEHQVQHLFSYQFRFRLFCQFHRSRRIIGP